MADCYPSGDCDCGHPDVQHDVAIRAGLNWFTPDAFAELEGESTERAEREGRIWWFCAHCVEGCRRTTYSGRSAES